MVVLPVLVVDFWSTFLEGNPVGVLRLLVSKLPFVANHGKQTDDLGKVELSLLRKKNSAFKSKLKNWKGSIITGQV